MAELKYRQTRRVFVTTLGLELGLRLGLGRGRVWVSYIAI